MNTVSSRLTDARQPPPTEANTLCASIWEPPRCIVGDVSQQGGVSLPGRRDLTVRAKSPGMFSFEILRHCGSRGVLWGVVGPAGVMPVCCPDDCARGNDAHTHIHTQIHTPLIYGYTAAQQDFAFVGSEYTQRVHSQKCVCVYALIKTHPDRHAAHRFTHTQSHRGSNTPRCPCCKHMGER